MIRRLVCTGFLATLAAMLYLDAGAQTIIPSSWRSAVSGNWTDGFRWTTLPLYPNNNGLINFNATIAATDETYIVNIDANITVTEFVLNSPDATLWSEGRIFNVLGPAFLHAGRVNWFDSTWAGGGVLTNNTNFYVRGNSLISSPFIQGGTLNIIGAGLPAVLTVRNSFTNTGAINLDSDDGHDSNLGVFEGVLTNLGEVYVLPGAGGTRTLSGSLTNLGIVSVEHDLNLSKTDAIYTNNNLFTLFPGKTLTLHFNSQTFNQSAGTLTLNGGFSSMFSTFGCLGGTTAVNGSFDMTTGAFVWNGGTLTGQAPKLNNSTLSLGTSQSSTGTVHLQGNCMLQGSSVRNQTIIIRAQDVPAKLTSNASFTNAGILVLDSATGQGSSLVLPTGTITNTGTLSSEAGSGGTRAINGSLINRGNFNVRTPTTLFKIGGTFANESALTVFPSGTLTISGNGQTFNQTSGSMAINGAVTLDNLTFGMNGGSLAVNGQFSLSNGQFTWSGGSIMGFSKPVLRDSTLMINGIATKTGTLTMRGTDTLAGNLQSGQTLIVDGNGGNALLNSGAGYTNAGTILLDSTDGSGSSLAVTSLVPIVNTGTIEVRQGAGGDRQILASITNRGTFTVNRDLWINKVNGVHTNEGTLTVSAGKTLTIIGEGQTVTQQAGTLTDSGNLSLEGISFNMNGGLLTIGGQFSLIHGVFNWNGGNLTGNSPLMRDTRLNIGATASSPATFVMRGICEQTGPIHVGQSLLVQGAGEAANLVSLFGVVSDGTITLDSTDGSAAGITVSVGSLLNTGVVNINPGGGGQRTVTGNVDNRDSLFVNASTTFSTTGGSLRNSGRIQIAANATATIPAGSTIENLSDVTVLGSLSIDGGTLNQSSGTLTNVGGTVLINGIFNWNSGNLVGNPIVAQNSTVNIGLSATNPGSVTLIGTVGMTGNVAAAQTVLLLGNAGSTAVTRPSGMSNAGVLTLDSIDASAVRLTAGSLTNTGTVTVHLGGGGARTIAAALTNTGTLNINANTDVAAFGGVFSSTGTLNVADAMTLNASGMIFGNMVGTTLSGGTFNLEGDLRVAQSAIRINAASVTLDGPSSRISNAAGADLLEGYDVGSQLTHGLTTNESGAKLYIRNGRNLRIRSQQGLMNRGLLVIESGSRLDLSDYTSNGSNVPQYFQQTLGATQLDDGTIVAGSAGLGVVGGKLRGSGTLVAPSVFNSAEILPGDAGAIGLLTVNGALSQTASGRLKFDLGGVQEGQSDLIITDSFACAGGIDVNFVNGHVPFINNRYVIMRHDTGMRTGAFTGLGLPTLSGMKLRMEYAPDHIAVVVDRFGQLPTDVNNDGCVDDADLTAVVIDYGNSGAVLPTDVNDDGQVDDADLTEVILNFGNGC